MSPEIRCAHDELVLVPDLKPNPDNPNKHDAAQLTLYAKILIHQGWRKASQVSTLPREQRFAQRATCAQ